MPNELAVVTLTTSNSRYHLADHSHPRRITIVGDYVAPTNGERTIAFTCLCCNRMFAETKKNIDYRSLGFLEPDLVNPITDTEF